MTLRIRSLALVRNLLVLMLSGVLATSLIASSLGQHRHQPVALPVRYQEHRFYLEPVTTEGVKLNLFTDTGGGLFLYRDAAERLKLQLINLSGSGEEAFYVASLPAFQRQASIPAPPTREGRIPIFAPPSNQRPESHFQFDGMLGQEWFGERVWTFDYPKRRLLLRAAGDVPNKQAPQRVALGFKRHASGERALNFPRIQVGIDGETLDLLFDTGATTFLTDEALAALRDGRASERATSFITTTTFEKWRKRHPDWRVIEKAEKGTGEAMIEVPSLFIAGYEVGPVWFTRRADKNFHQFMSQFMDKRVEGAIGGNGLRHFRITIDYPNAIAVFEK